MMMVVALFKFSLDNRQKDDIMMEDWSINARRRDDESIAKYSAIVSLKRLCEARRGFVEQKK